MGFRQTVWVLAFLAACVAAPASAAGTLSPQATAGIEWLQTQVQVDGSLANENLSIAMPLQARSETATALSLAGPIPPTTLGLIVSDTGTDTESVARHIDALVQGGQDPTSVVQTMLASQNADGGFGSQPGDSSDALDTAWALLSLRAANSTNANALSNALLYLVGNVDNDGGYGISAGGSGSQVYVTSYVLLAYQGYAQSYPLTQQISGARQWLVSQQGGGAYGDTLSNAIAALALASSSTDASTYAGALAALNGAQLSDGSWGEDPYLTALAARASILGTARASASTGAISGLVLDSVSHAPISGAQIQITGGTSSNATSGGNGSFQVSNLVPGTYAVSVAASGYGNFSLQSIQVIAGSMTTLGVIGLSAAPGSASLTGKLTTPSGAPIVGAQITLSGADSLTAVSAADGSYAFSGLIPGAVTISVVAAGFDTVSEPMGLLAGTSFEFSPALYPAGTTPASANLSGTVDDAVTQLPISGATITVGTLSATSGSDGRFALSGLTDGSYTAQVSAQGYTGAILAGSLADGINGTGLILLTAVAPSNSTTTVSGVVTDASTGKPIAGASVQVQGVAIAAVTDSGGNYQLLGITDSQFVVQFQAPGYLSHNSVVSLATASSLTLNASLASAASSTLFVKNISLDDDSYNPFEEAEISAEIDSSASQDQQVILDAQVVDALGNVVQDIPAIGLNLSTPPSAALRTVPAGGKLQQAFTFYVRNTLAGTYRLVATASDAGGDVLAEGGTSLTVNALAQIGGGLTANPPIAQANANQPIHITGTVSNLGNLPVGAGELQLSITVNDTSASSAAPTPSVALGTLYAGPAMAGAAKDAQGNIYVVGTFPDNRIMKIQPNKTSSVVKALPTSVVLAGVSTSIQPQDVAIDASGNFWVPSSSRWLVKVDPSGNLSYVDTGLSTLRNVDADKSGDLFITGMNGTTGVLLEMSPSGQFTTLVQNGLSKPVYMAADSSGDLYVSNFGDNTISKIGPGGVISTFVTGLNAPQGLATDTSGNLYVANSGANDVLMVSPTGTTAIYASGINSPTGLAFDPQGVLYVTDSADNSVVKVTASGAVTTFAQSAAAKPQGMRYDSQGNLYVANASNNTVTEVDSTGKVHVLATGLSTPEQVAIDGAGDVFVTDSGSGAISKISGGSTTTFATGLNQPWGIALDSSNNVYVAEAGGGRISEIPAAGGAAQAFAPSLLRTPQPIALAADGSLIVGNNGSISRIPLGGGGQVLVTLSGQPMGMSFDASGTLYYTLSTSLNKIVNGASVLVATIPATTAPAVFDSQGNYYVADANNKRIDKVSGGVTSTFAVLSGSPSWLTSDSSGNLYAVVGNQTVFKITPAAVVTQIINSHLVSGIVSLSVDANNHLVATNSNNSTIAVVGVDGSTQVVIPGLSAPGGAVELSNGTFAVTDRVNQALNVYSSLGAVQQQIYGFGAPHDMLWSGTTLYFNDSFGRFYSLVSGGYPQLIVASTTAGFFDIFGGKIYFPFNSSVLTLNPTTAAEATIFTLSGIFTGQPNGVALRSDGAMAIALPSTDQVVDVSAAKQVTATYTGINSPTSIAIDTSGDVFVADSFGSFGGVIELDPTGSTAKPVGVLSSIGGMSFDNSGHLFVTGSSNIVYQVNLPNGSLTPTQVAANGAVNMTLRGLAFSNGVLYAADNFNQVIRSVSGKTLPVYAVGIASPWDVRIGPDGAAYVADRNSGSVLRYSQGGLGLVVTGIANAESLNFSPSGTLYVGTTAAGLFKVSATGQPTDLGIESLLGGSVTVEAITFDVAADPVVTLTAVGAVEPVLIPVPPALPSPGTVVYTTTVAAPALTIGDAPASVDFGSWTPQFGGDYTFTVTSAQSGIAGNLSGGMHVGPYAQGQLSASANSLSPGDQAVGLSLGLQGLDFTSIATVEASDITLSITTNNGLEPAMGIEPGGDVDFLFNSTLTRVTPTGTKTVINNVGETQQLVGDLPIDAQGNIFISGSKTIQRYNPTTGQSTLYANLTGVNSMSLAGTGVLYAGVGDTIYAVAPDGSSTLFYTSPTPFFGLASDATGNVYLQTSNQLVVVTAQGAASVLSNQGSFEGEGRNIAGACSNNLFFTPASFPGSGQTGEEHTVMEYVGDTGQIAAVFNGLTINSSLGDIDFITYDRFHSQLLMWTDDTNGQIYSLPVFCGGIDIEAHVVTAPGQTLSGFSAAPTQTVSHTDGTTEYVWDLHTITTLGTGLQFGTTLSGLQIGQTRAVVQSAFLDFKNSFVAGSDVTLPLTIPNVSVAPAVALTVTTDASSYPANTPVNVNVGLNNVSVTGVGGILDVQVLDANGVLVADIDTQTASVSANSAVVDPAQWNTAAYVTGAYTVQATLKDATGDLLAQGSAPFSIGATSSTGNVVSAGVTTDKASYAPTDTVTIDDRLINGTSNAIADGISFTTTVTNPDGSVRWTNTSTVAEMVPGGLRDITFPLLLLNAAPGSYGVTLTGSLNGTQLPVASTTFTVQSSAVTASGVTGTLSVSPGQVPVADAISITGNLNNNGNAALSNVTATLAVVDPVGGQLVFQSPLNIANLAQGQSVPLQAAWTTAGNANQVYVAILLVNVGGVTQTVAQANFTLLNPTANLSGTLSANPAQVPLGTNLTLSGSVANAGVAISGVTATVTIQDGSGNTVLQSPIAIGSLGSGQSQPLQVNWTATGTANQTYTATLTATAGGYARTLAQASFTLLPPPDPTAHLTGTLVATPNQVQVGTALSFTGSVSNGGSIPVTGIVATVTVQDPVSGAIVFQSPVNIASLAAGQSTPLLANWTVTGTVNQAYTAVLTVTAGGKTKTLSSASFTIVPPPIKMTASMALGQHGRVLILTDDPAAYPGNQDPFGPSPAPGLIAQNQHLGAVLKAAGWSYTLVTNATDFQTQFNTGGYVVYVVLSEAVKLPQSLVDQINQAVNSGQAGLLVAGNHDDRNNALETALGVHSTGKNLSATGLVLAPSALESAGGQASFGIDGQPLSVNKASATVVGNFSLNGGGTAPAVFSNTYGSGKAIYMAFDLALEEAETPRSFLDQLFTDALAYVHPATLTPYTGSVLPIVLSIQNSGIATPGAAIVTLPAGVTVVDANGATVSGNTLTWTLNFAAGQNVTETFWVALPATAGSVNVSAVVDSGTSPSLTTQTTANLLIGVQAKPQ